jgi:2-hydroxychromene-2-carboxylate isomerase
MTAPRTIDWYFDFVSPFSYLQLEMMDRITPLASVRRRPVLLGGILNERGQLGPAEIPGKRLFTYRFVQWQAAHYGIPLKFPPSHPFNPIKALRLSIVLENEESAVRTIFRHLWRDGRSIDDPADWRALCERLGQTDVESRIAAPEVKAELKRNGDLALAAGLFGVPTFVVDGEPIWGADATEMVIDLLEHPGMLTEGEFARLATLPVGASRARG